MLAPSPAPPVVPVTCTQPNPKKVKILGGAGIEKGILVQNQLPDRTADVRMVIGTDLATLATATAAKYQAKEAPYTTVTPFVCPEPTKCDLQVTGSYTTNPDPVPVTYKVGPPKVYEGKAQFDLFAEANCVPKPTMP